MMPSVARLAAPTSLAALASFAVFAACASRPPEPTTLDAPAPPGASASATPSQAKVPAGGRCTASIDCANGYLCCSQYMGSGEDEPPACSEVCEIHELCVEGGPCSDPKAECVGGVCAMPLDKRRCGGVACPRERPYCCGSREGDVAPACSASCGEEQTRLECAAPRDCIAGACQRNVMGDTFCSLLVDVANAAQVCESDADCTEAVCMGSPGKVRCDVDEKFCTCDAG